MRSRCKPGCRARHLLCASRIYSRRPSASRSVQRVNRDDICSKVVTCLSNFLKHTSLWPKSLRRACGCSGSTIAPKSNQSRGARCGEISATGSNSLTTRAESVHQALAARRTHARSCGRVPVAARKFLIKVFRRKWHRAVDHAENGAPCVVAVAVAATRGSARCPHRHDSRRVPRPQSSHVKYAMKLSATARKCSPRRTVNGRRTPQPRKGLD